jgi:hypothetical protein
VLLGRGSADLGVCPGAKATGYLTADVQLDIGIAHQQCLGICVQGDELHPAHAGVDHAVDRIHPAATDTHHFDNCEITRG